MQNRLPYTNRADNLGKKYQRWGPSLVDLAFLAHNRACSWFLLCTKFFQSEGHQVFLCITVALQQDYITIKLQYYNITHKMCPLKKKKTYLRTSCKTVLNKHPFPQICCQQIIPIMKTKRILIILLDSLYGTCWLLIAPFPCFLFKMYSFFRSCRETSHHFNWHIKKTRKVYLMSKTKNKLK